MVPKCRRGTGAEPVAVEVDEALSMTDPSERSIRASIDTRVFRISLKLLIVDNLRRSEQQRHPRSLLDTDGYFSTGRPPACEPVAGSREILSSRTSAKDLFETFYTEIE